MRGYRPLAGALVEAVEVGEGSVPGALRSGLSRRTRRNTVTLTVANGISGVLGIVRGFYIPRLLVPADYGTWTLISVLLNYANYADAGINTGMILEAPRLIGEGRREKATCVQRQAYTATMVICGGISALVILLSFVPFDLKTFDPLIIRLIGVAVLVLALSNYYQVVARIRERFSAIGIATVAMAGIATAGVVAVEWAEYGRRLEVLTLISLLGSCVAALALAVVARSPLVWPLDWSSVARLVGVGLPVSLLPIGFTLFQSVDRWIVAALAPGDALGYYGLGATLGLFLFVLPNTLAIVLFTQQIERFGATRDAAAGESLVGPPLVLSGYGMALAAGGVVLAVPAIIHYLVPEYAPGTRAAIYQAIGNCLLFAVPVASNFLISTQRHHHVFGALAIGTLGEAALVALLVETSWGIDGAALAVLISDAVYGGLIVFLTRRLFGGNLVRHVGYVAACFAPFVICLPIAAVLLTASPLYGRLWVDLGGLTLSLVIYVATCVPLCFLLARMTGSLPRVLRVVG